MLLRTVLISSVTLTLSLHAASNQTGIPISNVTIERVDQNPLYQKAKQFFDNKQYEEAEPLFQKLSDSYPENETINFLSGRTKFELKKYEEAYIYYDRVLIKNPENDRTRLEMARVFTELKSYDEAKKQLELVLSRPIPPKVRKNVEKFLDAIKQLRKKHFFSGAVIVGIGYDSNVNNTTNESYLFDDTTAFTINKDTTDTQKDHDYYHREIAVLGYSYLFPSKEWTYDAQLVGFNQIQRKHADKNVFYSGLTTGPSYIQKLYKISLPVTADKLWYGSDPLMYTFGLSPNISYKLNDSSFLSSKVKLIKKKYYKETDKLKDSNLLELSLILSKKLSKKDTLIPSVIVGQERSTRSPNSDTDKNYYTLGLGYIHSFTKTIGLKLNYAYTKTKYIEDRPTVLGYQFPKQRDTLHTAGFEVNKKFSEKTIGTFGYAYTKNNSNNNDKSYNKYNITYNQTWIF